jgi:hypothetical protein
MDYAVVRRGGGSTMADNSDSKRDKSEAKAAEPEKEQGRRDVLKGGVVVGSAAVAAALTLPKKWTRPLVDAVVVPAHAQTSPGAPTPAPTSAPTRRPTPAPTPSPTPGG